MKILIVASPRSGSTNLFNALYKGLNEYKGFCEPFNTGSNSLGNPISEYGLNYSNVIVKLLSYDLGFIIPSYQFIFNLFWNNAITLNELQDTLVKAFLDYKSNFDRVILLSRRNNIEAAESYSFASKTSSFHSSYVYKHDPEHFNRCLNLIQNHKNTIELFSKSSNISITYYEDLFLNNASFSKDFLIKNNITVDNLNSYLAYLDISKKYRK
jgi:hypothetical protein